MFPIRNIPPDLSHLQLKSNRQSFAFPEWPKDRKKGPNLGENRTERGTKKNAPPDLKAGRVFV